MFEQEGAYGFLPHGIGIEDYYPHSALYNAYHSGIRERDLRSLACMEPDLAVVAECVNAMGLFCDCVEMTLWRKYRGQWAEDQWATYCEAMPGIAQRLRESGGDQTELVELYFAVVLPVAAAIDAGRMEVAGRLYRRFMADLLRRDEPVS